MLNFNNITTHIYETKEKAYQAFLDYVHGLFRLHEKNISVDIVKMNVQIEDEFISFIYNNDLFKKKGNET